jgi:NhaP-type Na+/H+ or K+/H+ antiporter
MAAFSTELFLASLAIVGVVIVISALLSGLIERSGLPQAAVFLLLGALIGPSGLGLFRADIDSAVLRVVSTLSLTLVLFTDALSLDLSAMRRNRLLAFLVVGPGTILTAALVMLAAWSLLGVSVPAAAILGAALASTDPVLLRGLVRRPGLNDGVRQALRLESGLNDVVVLPIVLIGTSLLTPRTAGHDPQWGHFVINLFLLGPAAGIAVGLIGVAALDLVRRRSGVRRDYESLYSLGIAFLAFAAAESFHGSGFLAAFTAGLTISALDVELCDCFLEYGETTAEMALMFTFVLFGTSLIWSGLQVIGWSTLLFTGAVLLARPAAFLPSLAFTKLSWADRGIIAWFGPRGLSSLLLVMLAVFAGVGGGSDLLSVCCLVVLVSVILHGVSPMIILRPPAPATGQASTEAVCSLTECSLAEHPTLPSSAAPDSLNAAPSDPEYVSIEELARWRQTGVPVVVFDSRTDRTYNESGLAAQGALRVHPDHASLEAEKLGVPRDATIAIFCA